MNIRVDRIPPALKHGAYAATAVLPGESQAAFENLHRGLIAEYAPSGVYEQHIVYEHGGPDLAAKPLASPMNLSRPQARFTKQSQFQNRQQAKKSSPRATKASSLQKHSAWSQGGAGRFS